MIVAVDVDYRATSVQAALVGFTDWRDEQAALELVNLVDEPPAEYQPGRFFERELPHLTAILDRVDRPIDAIVIDGYVWLAPDREGLGMHLHRARGVPVIGVAKTRFAGSAPIEVFRGESRNPLLVTAIAYDDAAQRIAEMHGAYRIPTLLKRVDTLARTVAATSA